MGAASESSTVGVALPRGTVTLVMTDIEGSTRLLQRQGRDYVGLDVHRTARICSAAHGGQVVLSHLTATLAADDLPEGVSLRELGEVHLKDLERPEHLTQLVIAGLPDAFPELRGARTTPFHGAEQALAAELATAGAGPPTRVGLEVRLLGPVEVWRGGARVPLSAAKQRMIVAVLAPRLGEGVSPGGLLHPRLG